MTQQMGAEQALEFDPYAHDHHSAAAVKAGLESPEAQARMHLSVTKILALAVG